MLRYIYKALYPLALFYWFIFSPKTTGVKCIVCSEDEVLLIKNTYGPTKWTLPGGGVHKGESPESTAKREVLEEVGIEVKDIRYLGNFLYTREYKKDTVHCFVARVDSRDTTIQESEVAEAKWFPKQSLPELSEITKLTFNLWI